MFILLILVLSCLIFRGLGFAGIPAFVTWQASTVLLAREAVAADAAYALIAFFLAVLPANIHAARAGVTLRGKPATSLWLRIPMQVLFIAVAFLSTR